MKKKILIIGGSYMNLQMKVNPKTKQKNQTFGSEYRYHPFGNSALTAIATAKLGGDCVFSTRFGNDTNGKRLYEYYKSCGILTDLMKKDENAQTGMSVTIFSDLETHNNYISHGANARFTKEEIDDAFITMPDMFLAPLEEIGYEAHTVMESLDGEGNKEVETALSEEDEAEEETEAAIETEEEKDGAIMSSDDDEDEDDENDEEESTNEKSISSETISSYQKHESLALYALQKAEDRNVDMLMQYTPFTAQFPLESLKNIKVLVVSDEMLYSVTGFFPNNTEKTLRALVALSQKIKSKYYIVQQGDDTVFVYDGVHYEIITAPVMLRTLTKNAGKKMQQTFIGALAAEYLESKNILRACKFAIVVSLLTKGKFGNLEKMMSLPELQQYAAENGFDLYK